MNLYSNVSIEIDLNTDYTVIKRNQVHYTDLNV